MLDEKKLAIVKAKVDGDLDADPLASMSPLELRLLRAEIDRLVPPEDIGNLNLEQELVEQYRTIKDLMVMVMSDMDTPANQKSQVANSVVSTLGQLVKLQEDLRREQTFKIMESCLVEALKALPEATRDAFYLEYERLAAKEGLLKVT